MFIFQLTNNTVQQGGVQMSGNSMTITRKIDNSNYGATPKQPQVLFILPLV